MNAYPYGGYTGCYLRVDLSSATIRKIPLPLEWAEMYLGGNGIGTKILWDEVPPEVGALSPANKLIIAPGPLSGGPMPNSGRLEFVAKSPLTGIYGDSNSGGHFGPELKFAGYDFIILEGCSNIPVYLYIHNDVVELRDATHLWGKGTFETEEILQREVGDPEIKVAAIGQAGENLVRYAAINVTYRRQAARSGMGAVMGSKNLKAVAVRGTGQISIANPSEAASLALRHHTAIRNNEFFPGIKRFGTPGLVALMNPMGRFPTKNFQFGSFDQFEAISGETLREEHVVRDISCYACPVGCDAIYEVRDREGVRLNSVEYENLNALGSNILNDDLESLLQANMLCDDWGLDTISAGRAIAFAMELADREILSSGEMGGLDLSWGSATGMLELLRQITFRDTELGDSLAEGSARFAKILGRGSEQFAMHVKGQDIAAQDGRAQQSMGLAHVTSSRGADHLKAFPVLDETGYPAEGLRRYGQDYLPEIVEPLETKYKAFLVKDGEDFGAVVDSCGNCKSGGTFVMAEIYWEDQAEALRVITGMEIDAEGLKQIGERIYNLQRCYNTLHGITSADDVLPARFTEEPSPSGNAKGSVCHIERMLPRYYELRGWDRENGVPLPETLERLALSDAAERIQESVRTEKAAKIRANLGWAEPYQVTENL